MREQNKRHVGQLLGIHYTKITKDSVVLVLLRFLPMSYQPLVAQEATMPVTDRHHQVIGLLHGGLNAVLVPPPPVFRYALVYRRA